MELLTKIFDQLSFHTFSVVGLIVLIVALVNCFLGYRLMKLWIAVIGFLVGALLGYTLAGLFTDTFWILLVSALAGGGILALIAFRLYLAGVFLYALITAYGFMAGLLGHEKWWTLMLCVIVALVVGILAVKFVRPVIIVTTAISGGFTAVNEVMGWLSVGDIRIVYGLALILAAVGILVQFRGKKF